MKLVLIAAKEFWRKGKAFIVIGMPELIKLRIHFLIIPRNPTREIFQIKNETKHTVINQWKIKIHIFHIETAEPEKITKS